MAQRPSSVPSSNPSRIGPPVEQLSNNKTASQVFECCKGGKCILHGGSQGGKDVKTSWSITNMPSEIAIFAIDPAVNYDAKAKDIARHSMDETLDAFQKAKMGFKSNDMNHKIYVTSTLDNLIRQNADRAFREIMPLFDVETKKSTNLEFHEAAAESAKTCFQLCFKHPVRAKQLIDLIVARVDNESTEISEFWCEGLAGVTDVLNADELQRDIIPIVKERFARRGASVNAKCAAAKVLYKLISRLDESLWSKRLYPVIESLCVDSDPKVRLAICQQLADISSRMQSKEPILNLLKKLSADVDINIRNATVLGVCQVVDKLNNFNTHTKLFFEAVIPMLKKSVKEAYVSGNTQALLDFSAYMGRVAFKLSSAGALSGENKLWFLDAFLHLSRYGLTGNAKKPGQADMPTGFLNFRANNEFARRHSVIESLLGTASPAKLSAAPTKAPAKAAPKSAARPSSTALSADAANSNFATTTTAYISPEQQTVIDCSHIRSNAAMEFPHFTKFAKPLVDFRTGLHPVIVDLMHDPAVVVRTSMATSLHPIIELLGTDSGILHGEFVYALSDDNTSVVSGLLPHLASILKSFTAAKLLSPEATTTALVEIGGALLFCEERLSQTNDWRMHATILEQMSVLPSCIPGDYIYNNFVPVLFHRLLRLRQLPARVTAAYTIVAFLRHCRKSSHRDDIRAKIKESLAMGRSKQDRMLHLMMSQRIMSEFSRKYYRDYFFETNLDMANDTVANVRIKAVSMMPDMKKTLHLSEDEKFLKKLETVAAEIKKKENDPDVVSTLEEAMEDMQNVMVVFKNDVNYNKVVKTKEDLEDEQKEMEENYIASLEPKVKAMTQKEIRKSFYQSATPKTAPAPTPPPPPPPPPPPQPPAQPPPQKTVPEARVPMSNLSRRALKTFTKMPDNSKPDAQAKQNPK